MTATATLTDERLDAAFAALADPTRRAIVSRLSRGDATAGVPASYHESVLRYSLAFVGRLATVDELVAEWGGAG